MIISTKTSSYKKYLVFVFLFFSFLPLFSQEQRELDSLLNCYSSSTNNKQTNLNLIKLIADAYNEPEEKLFYSQLLIREAKKVDSTGHVFAGLTLQGSAFLLKSDYTKALESFLEAARIAKKGIQTGSVYIQIADVYSLMQNHSSAVKYYKNALTILKNEKDTLAWAAALYNLGDEYLKAELPDSAIAYTLEAQSLYTHLKYKIGEAYCLGNLGVLYLKKGNLKRGEEYLNQSIPLLESLNEYAAICEFTLMMSKNFQFKNNIAAAKKYALRSLAMAKNYGLKKEISDAYFMLSELYEQSGNRLISLSYYKDYITYRDSFANLETVQKVADLRTDYEVAKKQKEVDLLNTKNKLRSAERNGFVFASLLLVVILCSSIYYYTQRAKRNKLLAAQKMQEAEILHQKNLMQSVITSQETERKRIGMDLHDEVGAALSTLRMTIDRDAEKLPGSEKVTANYKSAIDKIITNMRHISHALSPRISGSYGFYDAIHELADSVNISDHLTMSIQFDESNLPKFSDDQTSMALYRIISELVNNTLKHAQAKSIYLEVEVHKNDLLLTYRDDGIGLAKSTPSSSTGMGMNNIESRLNLIHAQWQLNSPATGGYEIIINVPIN